MERDKEPCGSGVSGIRGPCTSTTSSQAEGNLDFILSSNLPPFLSSFCFLSVQTSMHGALPCTRHCAKCWRYVGQ